MKIHLGKRYRRRDGMVVGPIIEGEFPFADSIGNQYTAEGYFYRDGGEDRCDLVEEYIEPVKIERWAIMHRGTCHVSELFTSLDRATEEFNQAYNSYYTIVKLTGEAELNEI